MSDFELLLFGANHRSAALPAREALAVPGDSLAVAVRDLRRATNAPEAALLSTCNRTEAVCLARRPLCADSCADSQCATPRPDCPLNWLVARGGGAASPRDFYRLRAKDAARHLFEVAAGLDSLILGEPEIAGQVKRAGETARRAGAAGTILIRLFEHALAAAKDVRAQTAIGRGSLSYPALAANAAAAIFPDFTKISLLVVGAGELAAAAGAHFHSRRAGRIAIANRSLEAASQLAARVDGEALPLARVAASLAGFDVVIAATGGSLPIIEKPAVEAALAARRRRPMMFADFGLPRDISPAVGDLPDVFLYSLDQLGAMADDSRRGRKAARAAANGIIDSRIDRFWDWLVKRPTVSEVRIFRAAAARAQASEVAAARARLARGEDPIAVVERLAGRLSNRLLHGPTRLLPTLTEAQAKELLAGLPVDDDSAAFKNRD